MPYTALDQFTDWDVDGGTPTWKRLDLVTGGSIGHPTDRMHRTGINAEDWIAYGLMVPTASIEGQLQTFAWSAHAERATVDALPAALQVAGGIKDAGIEAFRQRSMYINELTLACAGENEPWTYSAELVGLTSADLASPSAAATLAEDPMEWFRGSVKIDTASYTCDSCEVTLRNNLVPRGSLDEGTSTQLRWPDYIKVGNMEVTATVVIRAPLDIDIRVDSPEDTQFDLVVVMTNGSTTKTLTCTDLYAADDPSELGAGDDEKMWSIDLEAPLNKLTAWGIA